MFKSKRWLVMAKIDSRVLARREVVISSLWNQEKLDCNQKLTGWRWLHCDCSLLWQKWNVRFLCQFLSTLQKLYFAWSWKEYVQYIKYSCCPLGSNISTGKDVIASCCLFSLLQGPPGTWRQHPATFTLSLLWNSWRSYHHQSIQVCKTND